MKESVCINPPVEVRGKGGKDCFAVAVTANLVRVTKRAIHTPACTPAVDIVFVVWI